MSSQSASKALVSTKCQMSGQLIASLTAHTLSDTVNNIAALKLTHEAEYNRLASQIVTKGLDSRDNCLVCVQLVVQLLQHVSMSEPAIASHFQCCVVKSFRESLGDVLLFTDSVAHLPLSHTVYIKARTMALACSKLLAVLFKATIVSQELLHKCLQHVLAHPSNVRAEAAADILYQTEPYMRQHFEPAAVASMESYYHKLQHLCTGGCTRMDAGVISDVMEVVIIPRLGPMQGEQAKGRSMPPAKGRAKPSRKGRAKPPRKGKDKEPPEYGMVPPPQSYAVSAAQGRAMSARQGRTMPPAQSMSASPPEVGAMPLRPGRTMSPAQSTTASTPVVKAMPPRQTPRQGRATPPQEGSARPPSKARAMPPTEGSARPTSKDSVKPPRQGKGRARPSQQGKVKPTPEYGMVPPPPSYAISSEQGMTVSPPRSRPLSPPQIRPLPTPQSRPLSPPQGRIMSTRQGRSISPRQYSFLTTPRTRAMSLTIGRAAASSPPLLTHQPVNRSTTWPRTSKMAPDFVHPPVSVAARVAMFNTESHTKSGTGSSAYPAGQPAVSLDEVMPSATPTRVDTILKRPATASSHTHPDMQTSSGTPFESTSVLGGASDRHGKGLIKAGSGGRGLLADRFVSESLASSGVSLALAELRLRRSNSCTSVGSDSSATSTPAAVANDSSHSSMSCIAHRSYASHRPSNNSQSSNSSSMSQHSSGVSQNNAHQGSCIASSIGSSRSQAGSPSTAAHNASATHAAMPHTRRSQASGHDIHPAATRRLQYSAHNLNGTTDSSSSGAHDAALPPQVGLPPGLLGRAADGRLAPRASVNTQLLDRVQAPARAVHTQHLDGVQAPAGEPDISLAPAGKAPLTFGRMSDMLKRGIQELLLTHSRSDFLQSIQEVVGEWQGDPAKVLEEALHAMWGRLPDLSWLPPSKRVRYIRPRDPKIAAKQAVSRKFHKADTMTPAGPAPLNKDPFAREGSRSRALRGFEALIRPPVHSSNVGYRMMMKQGWTEGSGLGSRAPGRIEPIECDAATSSFLGIGCTRYKSIVTDERAELLLRAAIIDICVEEGCIFDTETVHTGVSAFVHTSLRWQTREAQHVLKQPLAWIGRMVGDLVAHNVLTDSQARRLVVSAAPDAEASAVTCMDVDDIPWHLGYAVNAGQHDPQLTMRQLAEQPAFHQVSVETMTYVVGPEGMAIKVQTCDLGAEGAVSAIVRTDRS